MAMEQSRMCMYCTDIIQAGLHVCVLVLACGDSCRLHSRLLECLLIDGTLASCIKSETR